jgi:hypothetical protein
MNLPPDLLKKLETEEDLEAVMAQASVITAEKAPQPVTTAAVAQDRSTDSQPPRQKSKGRKETSSPHQPGEYELKVMEKKRRNQEKLDELGLGQGLHRTQVGGKIVTQQQPQPKANPTAQPEASTGSIYCTRG